MIKDNSLYDLHTHSFYSDGSDSPSELIQKAKKQKLDTLALTDHDTIDGLIEGQREAQRLDINFINGIELSTQYDSNRLIHILGLDIDITQPAFYTRYHRFKKSRQEALPSTVKQLQQKGISLNISDLASFQTGQYLDRQTIAKWLVSKKYADSIPRAWINILDTVPYMAHEILHVQEALDMIHSAKGKAFIAHIHKPIGLYGYGPMEAYERLKQLKSQGLDGIESHYPTYSDNDIYFIQKVIKELNLLESGGSDYHGSNRPEIQLGQLT